MKYHVFWVEKFQLFGFFERIKFRMSLNSWSLFEASYPSFIKNIYNSYRYLLSTEHYTYAFCRTTSENGIETAKETNGKVYHGNLDLCLKYGFHFQSNVPK